VGKGNLIRDGFLKLHEYGGDRTKVHFVVAFIYRVDAALNFEQIIFGIIRPENFIHGCILREERLSERRIKLSFVWVWKKIPSSGDERICFSKILGKTS
jgi:hypothetical protein